MVKRKSMIRNQNHDDNASSKKKVNTNDNGGPWSDLNHHLLYLVMMLLGIVDYFSFGRVCKSWRKLAVSNRNAFMASKPPMAMRISWHGSKKSCYLEDFEGRKFKTILPRFDGGSYVGLTCGYLIFFRTRTREFWLVNPITRHELYFPNFPVNYPFSVNGHYGIKDARVILIFSLSICGWVFLVIPFCSIIWISIAGTGAWNRLFSTNPFKDIHAFKGIIYTLNRNSNNNLYDRLYELTLNPLPKLTLLETKNSLKPSQSSQLVSSGDNIYVMDRGPPNRNVNTTLRTPKDLYRFQELDFGEMKWVSREKTLGEYASLLSNLKYGVVERRLGGGNREQCLLQGHNTGDMLQRIELEKASSFKINMWYVPHECLNVDMVDE